jgi:hypothetical protein
MSIRAMQRARDFLDETQNHDGGWGYRVGSSSVTEPTALAVIARSSQAAWEGGVAWLLSTQRDDGGWGLNAQDDASNWLALWATRALLIAATEDALLAAGRGVDWLLELPTVRSTDTATVSDVIGLFGIDLTLYGWPWQPGDASFVEPTALGLLVLTTAGLTDHPRLLEGVAYLHDRVCQGGGWNVGNPYMFEKPLPPTPHSTALALSALRATGADHDHSTISESLDALREILTQRVAADSLALGMMALRAWQADDASLRDRLLQMQSDDGGWERSPYATASALLALQGPETIFSLGG